MKRFFKKYGRYILIFILVFLIYEVFCYGISYGDPINNYGFSYAIARGEVPYRDFNTISTPLFAFYGSLGLHIWNNYIMFILEQVLLFTIMFYLLYNLYGNKSYLILMVFVLGCYGLLPTYNFFCFFMMVILLYLEKKYPDKDYIIGFFIGLSILSKHTVGVLFILPSIIIYFRDYKKIIRRFIGLIIPCLLFFLYLILNDALYSFVDLCILGLLDFSSNNGNLFNSYFYASILIFILSVIITIKNRKDINNYYLLCSFSFVVPLFDLCHFSLYFLAFIIMILSVVKYNKIPIMIASVCIIVTYCMFSLLIGKNYDPVFSSKINHFNYTLNSRKGYKGMIEVSKYINKYNAPIVLSSFAIQYNIMNDKDISYYDIFLYGNFGYNGNRKLIDKIAEMHDQIFVINMKDYNKVASDNQFNKEVIKYIIDHSKKIDYRHNYVIYYKK